MTLAPIQGPSQGASGSSPAVASVIPASTVEAFSSEGAPGRTSVGTVAGVCATESTGGAGAVDSFEHDHAQNEPAAKKMTAESAANLFPAALSAELPVARFVALRFRAAVCFFAGDFFAAISVVSDIGLTAVPTS